MWSLGCTLYSMAFGWSPFESPTEGVQPLAIMNGNVSFPPGNIHFDVKWSDNFCKLIKWILVTDPRKRPKIKDVMRMTEKLII